MCEGVPAGACRDFALPRTICTLQSPSQNHPRRHIAGAGVRQTSICRLRPSGASMPHERAGLPRGPFTGRCLSGSLFLGPLLAWGAPVEPPAVVGIPIDFILFALTLAGGGGFFFSPPPPGGGGGGGGASC